MIRDRDLHALPLIGFLSLCVIEPRGIMYATQKLIYIIEIFTVIEKNMPQQPTPAIKSASDSILIFLDFITGGTDRKF